MPPMLVLSSATSRNIPLSCAAGAMFAGNGRRRAHLRQRPSTDRSLEILSASANGTTGARLLNMSRRFGVAEVGAPDGGGGEAASNDADLQGSAEVIPDLISRWRARSYSSHRPHPRHGESPSRCFDADGYRSSISDRRRLRGRWRLQSCRDGSRSPAQGLEATLSAGTPSSAR